MALAEDKRRRREEAGADSKELPRTLDSVGVASQDDVDNAGVAVDAPWRGDAGQAEVDTEESLAAEPRNAESEPEMKKTSDDAA